MPLVEQRRGACQQRAVDHVAVPGNPGAVGRTPENVRGLDVEDPVQGAVDPDHIAAVGVYDALGLAGRARGVEHEEHVLGVHDLGRGNRTGLPDQIGIPQIARFVHLHFDVGPVHHDHRLHRHVAAAHHGLVHDVLQIDHAAVAVEAVHGHDQLGIDVHDAISQRLGRKTREHRAVDRADLGHGQQGDDRLRQGRHVEHDPVALAQAQRAQRIRELVHLAVQLVIGQFAAVPGLALPDQRQPVLVGRLDVPVQGVVDDVALGARKPLVKRGLGVVEHAVPFLEPVQLLGRAFPVGEIIPLRQGAGLFIGLQRKVGLGRDLGQRTKYALLVEQGVQCAGLVHVILLCYACLEAAQHCAGPG